jgi:hypothetical protein
MSKYIITIFLLYYQISFSQKTYWQQTVNFNINVSLNDSLHALTGDLEITYINNSPNKLDTIFFHCWPNAFSNNRTDFCKQKLEAGNSTFYYTEDINKGYLNNLDFYVNLKAAKYYAVDESKEIIALILNNSLLPGDSCKIATPFYTKIPYTFSRLGHVKQQYCITQWFPKPAVYDASGWHTMTYLDQGEFYSEFGNYKVNITLPENYVVAATGLLVSKQEIDWLNERVIGDSLKTIKDKEVAKSSLKTKTINYEANNVHDFAWFADKEFKVMKGIVKLNTGRLITTWSFFQPSEYYVWKNSIKYINNSVKFYSENVGEYLHGQCTAVCAALTAGGGMEYPMITVIGKTNKANELEKVIAHEVGHNWFQGMLGSNERRYPWMDEGINSYYDSRYTKEAAYNKSVGDNLGLDLEIKALNKSLEPKMGPNYTLNYLGYLYTARRNQDQASGISSEEYLPINYFADVYGKVPLSFNYLEEYLGRPEFDRLMKLYFDRWKLKHPYPNDIRDVFQENTITQNLDWFWQDLVNSNFKMDYKIKKVNAKNEVIGSTLFSKITIVNKGGFRSPYCISGMKGDSIIKTIYYGGFLGEMDVLFPSGNYDKFRIDANGKMAEINKENNTYRTKGIFRKIEPIQFKLLGGFENPFKNKLYIFPAIGANRLDRLLLGMAFYNNLLPNKKLEYIIAPLYSLGTNSILINGKITYTQNTDGKISKFVYQISNKNFSDKKYLENINNYNLIKPRLEVHLKKKYILSTINKYFFAEHFAIKNSLYNLPDKLRGHTQIGYSFIDKNILVPQNIELKAQWLNNYGAGNSNIKLLGVYKQGIRLNRSNIINMQLFVGKLFTNGELSDYPLSMSSFRGSNDYLYDDVYFSRMDQSEPYNLLSQQINNYEGGFKSLSYQQTNNNGISHNFLTSFYADIKIPIPLPLKLYGSVGYSKNKTKYFNTSLLTYESGISFFIPKFIEINFPIYVSQDWRNAINNSDLNLLSPWNKYLKRISFSLNLKNANPLELIHNANF